MNEGIPHRTLSTNPALEDVEMYTWKPRLEQLKRHIIRSCVYFHVAKELPG